MTTIRNRCCKALAWLAVLGSCVVAAPAFAGCRITQTGFLVEDIAIDMGRVTIPPGLPVGAVIREFSRPLTGRPDIITCTVPGGFLHGRFVNAAQSVALPGFSNVYATDVRGVGIRVSHRVGMLDDRTNYYNFIRGVHSSDRTPATGSFLVELIKTAEQTGTGRIAPLGRFTVFFADDDGASRPIMTSSFQGLGTIVINQTCEVDAGSRNIAVNFGSVPNTSFTGVGSRAVNRDFDIRLNCQGSAQAELQSGIGIRLDAAPDASYRPGVIRLSDTANRATGIGIEIVQRDGSSERQVYFGQTIGIGMTTVDSATLNLPLRARYMQTQAGLVGSGLANGQATFTIQYN